MRTGCLFSGYGGLSMAVNAYFGATTAWFSEFDTAPSRILAHHWPDTPNHGDITRIDWASVEPVDILTGGYPCQPFSAAGRRQGTHDDRHLWPYVREAIRHLRPRFTVLENVAGHRSLGFDRVLGDLAEDGLHAQWVSVRASDVGACHHRERLFILVTPADAGSATVGERPGEPSAEEAGTRGSDRSGDPRGERDRREAEGLALLPTPVASDWKRNAEPAELDRHSPSLGAISHLLPTPRATDGTKGGPNQHGSSGDLMLPSAPMRLLSTPQSRDHKGVPSDGFNTANLCRDVRDIETNWGPYETAIRRAELACGRPAPAPTEPNRNGNPRLSSAFAEWMMMLPDGHVTGIGLSRNEELKAIGNGVVVQQALAALERLVPIAEQVAS